MIGSRGSLLMIPESGLLKNGKGGMLQSVRDAAKLVREEDVECGRRLENCLKENNREDLLGMLEECLRRFQFADARKVAMAAVKTKATDKDEASLRLGRAYASAEMCGQAEQEFGRLRISKGPVRYEAQIAMASSRPRRRTLGAIRVGPDAVNPRTPEECGVHQNLKAKYLKSTSEGCRLEQGKGR